VSLTTTVKVQLLVPQSLEAVQLTAFVPTVNVCGDVMTFVPIVHSRVPVKVGLNGSSAVHCPASVLVVM
jgi:shikimate kinase